MSIEFQQPLNEIDLLSEETKHELRKLREQIFLAEVNAFDLSNFGGWE
jgi:hypothetical protein